MWYNKIIVCKDEFEIHCNIFSAYIETVNGSRMERMIYEADYSDSLL